MEQLGGMAAPRCRPAQLRIEQAAAPAGPHRRGPGRARGRQPLSAAGAARDPRCGQHRSAAGAGTSAQSARRRCGAGGPGRPDPRRPARRGQPAGAGG